MIGEYVLILPMEYKDFKLNTYLGKLEKGLTLSETRKMLAAPMHMKYDSDSRKPSEVLLYFRGIREYNPFEFNKRFRLLRLGQRVNLASNVHDLEYILSYPFYGSFPSVSFLEQRQDEPFRWSEAIYDYFRYASNCFEKIDDDFKGIIVSEDIKGQSLESRIDKMMKEDLEIALRVLQNEKLVHRRVGKSYYTKIKELS